MDCTCCCRRWHSPTSCCTKSSSFTCCTTQGPTKTSSQELPVRHTSFLFSSQTRRGGNHASQHSSIVPKQASEAEFGTQQDLKRALSQWPLTCGFEAGTAASISERTSTVLRASEMADRLRSADREAQEVQRRPGAKAVRRASGNIRVYVVRMSALLLLLSRKQQHPCELDTRNPRSGHAAQHSRTVNCATVPAQYPTAIKCAHRLLCNRSWITVCRPNAIPERSARACNCILGCRALSISGWRVGVPRRWAAVAPSAVGPASRGGAEARAGRVRVGAAVAVRAVAPNVGGAVGREPRGGRRGHGALGGHRGCADLGAAHCGRGREEGCGPLPTAPIGELHSKALHRAQGWDNRLGEQGWGNRGGELRGGRIGVRE